MKLQDNESYIIDPSRLTAVFREEHTFTEHISAGSKTGFIGRLLGRKEVAPQVRERTVYKLKLFFVGDGNSWQMAMYDTKATCDEDHSRIAAALEASK